jgi:hypothetical protein
VDRDIALGLVRTATDLSTSRQRAREGRRTVLKKRQAPVAADVEAMGGKVVALCESAFCMTVDMTAAQVVALAGRNPDIARVDLARIGTTETGDAGAAVAGGSQITAMLLGGWDGEGQFARIPVAQVEAWTGADNCGLNPTHPGFNDTSSGSSRVFSLLACTGTSCSAQSTTYWAANYKGLHATGVANLLIGDLNDGQDATITDGNDRWDKSGYSHESFLAYAMCVLPYSGAFTKAMDYLVAQPIGAEVVNISAQIGDDPQCLGQNTESRRVNDLFEDGQLVFKSAGNTAGSSTDCTVMCD